MNFQLKVSIVMPVFNGESYIFDALNSIKMQTFKDFECIIINGSSTDNTLIIIEQFIASDNRFKCYTIENMGSGNAHRQYGIGLAKSDIIYNIDADDIIAKDSIEKMYNTFFLQKVDIVLQKTLCFEKEVTNILWELPIIPIDSNICFNGKDVCAKTIGGWEISCAGMLVKKELYNGVPADNLMNSDELTSRYLLYNAESVVFSDGIYYYRNHNSSISRAVSPRIFEKLIVDNQLDSFISARYDENTNVPARMRNTRFFNLLFLHSEFHQYKEKFPKSKQLEIESIIKTAYYSQNFVMLKKELPHYSLLFLKSFFFFKINSIVYRTIKKLQGKKYILK